MRRVTGVTVRDGVQSLEESLCAILSGRIFDEGFAISIEKVEGESESDREERFFDIREAG